MRLLILLVLCTTGCYSAHEAVQNISCDAGVGICLIDFPCWCRSEADAGHWRCFQAQADCDSPDCEFRWGSGVVDPADYSCL